MSINPHTKVKSLVSQVPLTPVTSTFALPVTLTVPTAPVAATPAGRTLFTVTVVVVPNPVVALAPVTVTDEAPATVTEPRAVVAPSSETTSTTEVEIVDTAPNADVPTTPVTA